MGDFKRVTFTNEDTAREVCAHYNKILTAVAEDNNIQIEVCVCHGNRAALVQNPALDKLYIYVQVAPPEISYGVKHVDSFTLNGEVITFPIKEGAVQPCPQGDMISILPVSLDRIPEADRILDDTGRMIAFIYQFNLYIMNDFIHSRNPDELGISRKVFDYIFAKACNELGLINRFRNSYEEKAKMALTQALQDQLRKTLEKEKIQVKAAMDTIAQYTTGIVDCERRVMIGEQVVASMEKEVGNLEQTMLRRWEDVHRLAQTPFYESIQFTPTALVAHTAPILCTYKDVTYYYGKYKIELEFKGNTKIIGETKINNQFDHPHINNGNVCWGNFSGVIPKLIGACQFDVALNMIYQFLEHYDEANPYKTITAWPVATKEQVAKYEQNKEAVAKRIEKAEQTTKKAKKTRVVAQKIATRTEDADIFESTESEVILEEAVNE